RRRKLAGHLQRQRWRTALLPSAAKEWRSLDANRISCVVGLDTDLLLRRARQRTRPSWASAWRQFLLSTVAGWRNGWSRRECASHSLGDSLLAGHFGRDAQGAVPGYHAIK